MDWRIRPLDIDDVPDAARSFDEAFDAMRLQQNLPPLTRTPERDIRIQRRVRHFLTTDPDGSWVAEVEGRVIGISQAFIRGDLWILSLLGVSPTGQSAGVGKALLERTLNHGSRTPIGAIQSSRDPRAMALYAGAGFALHPGVAAYGRLKGRTHGPADGVRRGDLTDLPIVAAIDRSVRGAERTEDLEFLLGEPGNRLLLAGETAYAVAMDDRVVTIGGLDEESATEVLRASFNEAPRDAMFELNWMTAGQQWAIRTAIAAGLELRPHGPLMMRGGRVPTPYLPSGGYGC